MLRRLLASQKLRFLAVGATNTAIAYGLYTLGVLLLGGDNYLLAYVLSYAISLVIGFTLQKIVVFRVRGHLLKDFLRYSSVQLGAFFVNLGLLPVLVELALFPPLIAQGVVLVITLAGSYFAHRFFSFRRHEKEL